MNLDEYDEDERGVSLEDICEKYNGGEVDQDTLRTETVKLGFLNVIDAFHNVANNDVPFRFFDDSRKDSNGITITDNFYRLLESEQKDNFLFFQPKPGDERWQKPTWLLCTIKSMTMKN